MNSRGRYLGHRIGSLFAISLVLLLVLPLVALLLSAGSASLSEGLSDPLFGPALALSLRTTALALIFIVVLGTPLAWWLSRGSSRGRAVIEALVELPIVMPPAVLGVALLQAFGRSGVFSPVVGDLGGIPFTETAVVLAQIVVAAPFYVQGAANAFREVDSEMIGVARSLGSSPAGAFLRVAWRPRRRQGSKDGSRIASVHKDTRHHSQKAIQPCFQSISQQFDHQVSPRFSRGTHALPTTHTSADSSHALPAATI